MPVSPQTMQLFVVLGEAAGRPVHEDEIAAAFYGEAEWPESYRRCINMAAQKLRPILRELGLGIACRLRTYWLCDAADDVTVLGYREPGFGFNERTFSSRVAIRNAAVIVARRGHLSEPRARR